MDRGRYSRNGRKSQSEMTATASKYPQGYFKRKPCKWCSNEFQPNAPSHLYCSQACVTLGFDANRLRKAYGLEYEEYLRLQEVQKGLCAICGGEGFELVQGQRILLVIDHCHVTGKVRGLLCHNCNRGIGLMQDSPENLRKAAEYLEGATTIPQGSTLKRAEAHSTPEIA